ncbi:MAG: META domain-containing protein [Treponema sp.]|jgi:hypothetical protein|nr:META domain-containing protein [Treponema sp.]
MKTITILSVLAGGLIASCAGNATAIQTAESVSTAQESEALGASVESPVTFDSGVVGISWRLSVIKKGADTIRVDRTQLEADGMGGVYTLRFADGNAAGKGAPNNFRAPYKTEGASLSIGLAVQTLMAAVKEPEVLKENEFFDYLANVSSWSLADGILTLEAMDADGNETALSFIAE